MGTIQSSDNWMTPEEALSRFNNEEMSLLDLNLPTVDDSVIRYGFKFENVGFMIGDGVLSEIISDYTIYPMPNCSSWLSGLANVRGNLVPVYDLRKLFGFKSEEKNYNHLLIIDQGSDSIGVLIESLPQPLDVSDWKPSSHRPEFSVSISGFVNATYLIDAVAWIDFDHSGFFKSIREKIAV